MRAFQLVLSYVGAALLGAVIGFFAGRRYLKYEIRTGVASTVAELRKDVATALAPASSVLASAAVTHPNLPSAPTSSRPTPATANPAAPVPITVAFLAKGFELKNIDAGQFDAYIALRLSSKNTGRKNIRAFDGVVHLTDLLDNEILASNLAVNEPVAAGAQTTWSGSLKYNEFSDALQRRRSAEQKNLKIRFVLKKVLFADGTTRKYNDD